MNAVVAAGSRDCRAAQRLLVVAKVIAERKIGNKRRESIEVRILVTHHLFVSQICEVIPKGVVVMEVTNEMSRR